MLTYNKRVQILQQLITPSLLRPTYSPLTKCFTALNIPGNHIQTSYFDFCRKTSFLWSGSVTLSLRTVNSTPDRVNRSSCIYCRGDGAVRLTQSGLSTNAIATRSNIPAHCAAGHCTWLTTNRILLGGCVVSDV